MEIRQLKEQEHNLIKYLLSISDKEDSSFRIPHTVDVLEVGKMGSIRFISAKSERIYAADLIQVQYQDEDNVPVIITLTIDNYQNLHELDFWKVNFEKLLRYPKPNEVAVQNK